MRQFCDWTTPMPWKLFVILVFLCAAGCTETPGGFPPCLDPNDNFMNDCPALDAGGDATGADTGAGDACAADAGGDAD